MPKVNNYRYKRGQSQSRSSRNPLILILGGLVLLVVALGFALRQQQQPLGAVETASSGGTPRLAVDKQQVDLGDVSLGTLVTVNFKLSNTGDGTVRLSRQPYVEVKEGC